MPALAEVAREKLEEFAALQRKRALPPSFRHEGVMVERDGKMLISFSCNDYLGLSQHPAVKAEAAAAAQEMGTGAGASRLVTGNHPLYAKLEKAIARWKQAEAALVFGSGYLANIGVIPALVGKGDLILADRLVHACIIDGAQLSGAKFLRFKHNDVADCAQLLQLHRAKYARCLILTDEVFSMDGDIAPLHALKTLAEGEDAWLMADGAHSLLGHHPSVDVYVGTLSKALGSYGGYVCASREIIDYLTTAARSLMFSTGLPPSVIAASLAALEIIQAEPVLAEVPLTKARLFTEVLGLPPAQSAIVPLVLGEESEALKAAAVLQEAGFLVTAIRPPAVPEGSSRLRFAFSALHSDEDVLRLVQVIKKERWA